MDANDKPVIDYDHCKGCLICATECPKHAIEIIREMESWRLTRENTNHVNGK